MRQSIQLTLLMIISTFFVGCISVEEADYEIVRKDGDFEVRKYAPHILAETEVNSSLEESGNIAFRRLFGYISGKNKSKDEIAMTAPVSQQASSQKIAMTAPVSQQQGENGWMVSFMMPMNYTMETLPEPEDPNIKLRQIPERYIATVQYSGTWSEENYLENLNKLNEWVQTNKFTPTDSPIWARYNPPFTLWFLRRNEILIPVKKPVD